ncbi:MAG: hypothetical protein R3F34_09695 [Planctomycetota bacterium]
MDPIRLGRRALLGLVVALGAASCRPAPAARAWGGELVVRNQRTYAAQRDTLRAEHAGEWMAIAQGEVLGPFEDFQRAVNAVQRRDPGTFHAFVYRPGLDDEDFAIALDTSDGSHAFVGGALLGRLAEASGTAVPTEPIDLELVPLAPIEDVEGFTTEGAAISGFVPSTERFDLALDAATAKRAGARRFYAPAMALVDGAGVDPVRTTWVRARSTTFGLEAVALVVLLPDAE